MTEKIKQRNKTVEKTKEEIPGAEELKSFMKVVAKSEYQAPWMSAPVKFKDYVDECQQVKFIASNGGFDIYLDIYGHENLIKEYGISDERSVRGRFLKDKKSNALSFGFYSFPKEFFPAKWTEEQIRQYKIDFEAAVRAKISGYISDLNKK